MFIQMLPPIKMKRLTLLIGLVLLILSSCSETTNSNKLDSEDYNTKEERVKVLKKEIESFSELKDADFELYNANGFSDNRKTSSGVSSWEYKFVIKVNPADVDKWTDGMDFIGNVYFDSWMIKLIQKRQNIWKTFSEPEFYSRHSLTADVDIIVIYREEGIIFKIITNR